MVNPLALTGLYLASGLYLGLLGSVCDLLPLLNNCDAVLVLAPFFAALLSIAALRCASLGDKAAVPLSRVGCCSSSDLGRCFPISLRGL